MISGVLVNQNLHNSSTAKVVASLELFTYWSCIFYIKNFNIIDLNKNNFRGSQLTSNDLKISTRSNILPINDST